MSSEVEKLRRQLKQALKEATRVKRQNLELQRQIGLYARMLSHAEYHRKQSTRQN